MTELLTSGYSPRGFGVKGNGAEASFLVSVSPASPPQGELNGRRGLVPSNFLEGPGPELGSSDREPGTPQVESQVSEELASQHSRWVSPLLVWWWDQDRVVGPGQGCGRAIEVDDPSEHCVQAGAAELPPEDAQAGPAPSREVPLSAEG